jgi:ribonuclease Z
MIIMPLGISSATPTANRHLASVALWRDGRIFLFDCGENAQMRMLQAGMKRSKVDYIFITHLHGDHYFGLLGLIATLHIQRRDRPLYIVAPTGIKEFVEFNLKIAGIEPAFEIHITELADAIEHQVVVDETDFFVEARPLKHSKSCFGFRYQERDKPGKVNAELATELGITEDEQFKQLKNGIAITLSDGTLVEPSSIVGEARKGDSFAYVTDTDFCENAVLLGKDATILYHEATFGKALEDKALETGHSTAEMAADVAVKANAKRLVLGHFSARYSNQYVLLKEARRIFAETWLATELRPIMTDPIHEKAIFKTMADAQSDSFSSRSPRGRDDHNDRPRKKRMMTRRSSPVEGNFRREQRGPDSQGGDYYRSRGPSRPPYQREGGFSRGGDRPYNRDQGGYPRGGDRPYNRDQGGYSRGGDRPYNRDQAPRPPQRDQGGYSRGGDRPYNRDYNRDAGYDRPYNRDNTSQDRPYNRDYNRSDRAYNRDQDRPIERRRPGIDDDQGKRDDNQRPASQDRRPITPRNNFDDYDRF